MGGIRGTQRYLDGRSLQRTSFLQPIYHAKKSAARLGFRKVRILIVDDEQDLRQILSEILVENGYLTDTTPTVFEAMEKLKATRYNLMITDIRLPDRSGIELVELAEKTTPETAVIILTAFPETETAIRALNHGAFNYLTKPFRNQELLSAVDKALAKQNGYLEHMNFLEKIQRKNEKLERLSITDRLTGVYNRAYLEEMLAREEMRFKRYKRPLAIVMVDINDLKYINDHFGHLKGDMIIKETAKLLRNTCRVSDIVARYGGDEFTILLAETTSEGALSLTNSLRKAVNEWNLSHTNPGLSLNLAFGYACVQNGTSLIDALCQADANMYQDKMSQKGLNSYQ